MDKFDTYGRLLLEYNKVHRLSGAKDLSEVDANVEDSLYPMQFLDTKKLKTAVDIGTGAGFPGLILAMAYPHIRFTLVEPLMKRTAFLHLVKSTLGLDNVTIKGDRIENITPFSADLITSRAVAKTDALIDLAKGFIGPQTVLLFYKGEGVHEELQPQWQSEVIRRGKRNYLFIKGLA
jgi:16S rRNA (guanine527-N7)-methyltransferase